MNEEVLLEVEEQMEKAVSFLVKELATVRTGRANASILDTVRVDYFDTPTPINQLATISIPESRLIVIQPWDTKVIAQIEKAIMKSDLGINPNSDGKVIRIPIPELTEERRRELVKKHKRRWTEKRKGKCKKRTQGRKRKAQKAREGRTCF